MLFFDFFEMSLIDLHCSHTVNGMGIHSMCLNYISGFIMVHVMNPPKKRPRNFSNGHVATCARRWSTWQTNSDERRSRTASILSHQLTTLVRGKIMEEIVTIQKIKATCAQVVECERSCSESWLVGWLVGWLLLPHDASNFPADLDFL